jgi:hypothetical protein
MGIGAFMRNCTKNEYNTDLTFIPELAETYRNLIYEANFSIDARTGRGGEEALQGPTITFYL